MARREARFTWRALVSGPWNGQVLFNNLVASVLSWTDTSIEVYVPSGATTGPVTVVKSGISSPGVTFTVEGPPTVSGIEPTIGNVNSTFTVTGTGFGATRAASRSMASLPE